MNAEAETLLTFPCNFPIKIMGRKDTDLETVVTEIMDQHIPGYDPACINRRQSENGNFVSLTVVFEATSKEQVDHIYQALTANEKVLMVL